MKETFGEAVFKKAKELKITPKFLLIAIRAIAENANVEAASILRRFGKELCIDMKNAALKQLEKGSKGEKLAAAKALEKIDPRVEATCNFANAESGLIGVKDLMEDGEQLKQLHAIVLNEVLKDAVKIREYRVKAKSFDIVEIIKYLCPELIERCRVFWEQ